MVKHCHKCKNNNVEIGINVFDAVTGSHIITRWYCMQCATDMGVIKNDTQTDNNTGVHR